MVKPSREGSSMGCLIVRNEEGWHNAFEDAASFCEDVLVEEYIWDELTVGIVGDQILPVVEIVLKEIGMILRLNIKAIKPYIKFQQN